MHLLRLYSLSLEKSEFLDDDSDKSCFVCLRCLLFLSHPLLLDLLYLLSSDKSDLLDDETGNYGSDSGPLVCALFPFVFTIPLVVSVAWSMELLFQ